MIHDDKLLDQLSQFEQITFEGDAYRATRLNHDPLAPSRNAGRWAFRDETPVLYTSLERDGAIAELVHHWSLLTPAPTKPAVIHQLRVGTEAALRLVRTDLARLGVVIEDFASMDYGRCQAIGTATAFLECDGLIVPSARWPCENLVIFTDNQLLSGRRALLELVCSEEFDWQTWAREHGLGST